MSAALKFAALDPLARKAAQAAVDEATRPLTKIEIEDALQPIMSRSLRRPVARALARFNIVVLAQSD